MKEYKIQYCKPLKALYTVGMAVIFIAMLFIVFFNISISFDPAFEIFGVADVSSRVLLVIQSALCLFCIWKTIYCGYGKIKVYDGHIKFLRIRWPVVGKVYISDISEIFAEKNSIMHDKRYTEDSIVVDFKIFDSWTRVSMSKEDYLDFIDLEPIKSRLAHRPKL